MKPLFVRELSDPERHALQAGLRSSDGFTVRRCHILWFCQGSRHCPWPTDLVGYRAAPHKEGRTRMRCLECGSEAVTERPERTARVIAGSAADTTASSSMSAVAAVRDQPLGSVTLTMNCATSSALTPAPINTCPPMAADWPTSGGP